MPHVLMPDDPLAELRDLCLFLGGSEDSFTGRLLELVIKADPSNRARLRLGFPRQVRALELWMTHAPHLTAGFLEAMLRADPLAVDRYPVMLQELQELAGQADDHRRIKPPT